MQRITTLGKGAFLTAAIRGLLGCRPTAPPPASPPPSQAGDYLTQTRRVLRLEEVQSDEEQVIRQPSQTAPRVALAARYAETGDHCGAALALYPLTAHGARLEQFSPYIRHCLALHWLPEAEAALGKLKPAPVALQLVAAGAHLDHGDPLAAMARVRAAEAAGPSGPEWFDGASLQLRAGRPRQALAWVGRGLRTHPATPAVLTLKANCLLRSGDAAGALRVLGAISDTAPPDPERLLLTGRAELRSGAPVTRRQGLERLAQLATTGSGNPAAAFDAGSALLREREWRRSADLLNWALRGGYQQVRVFELLGQANEQLGSRAEALLYRGRAYLGRWQLPQAEQCLREAVKLTPKEVSTHLYLARTLSSAGRPAEALQVLVEAERLLPRNLELALLKASVLGRLERVKEQTACLSEAAEWDPARANEPLGELGKLYYESQQYDLARSNLDRAVALDRGDAYAHLYLGLTYTRQSSDEASSGKAVLHLLQAATASPDYFFPWMNAGAVLQRTAHLPEAAACFRRAIDGDSRWEGPYASLGQLLQKQRLLEERKLILRGYARARRLEQLRNKLENAVHQRPLDPAARLALGDRHLRDGDARAALEELVIAASLAPRLKPAQQRLADACALLDYDSMRQEAERAAH